MGQEGIMEKTLPTIFRLSDLLEDMRSGCGPPTGLPLLCQCVWEKGKGKKACENALIKVRLLLEKCENELFISCCCHALKVIPFKTNKDDAYLVHTRSIVPDYVHLGEVAKLLEKSVQYVEKQLWEPVPALDETFAQEALRAVEQRAAEDVHPNELSTEQKEILSDQGEKVRLLARVYSNRFPQDHPAFDVVVYNMLKGSKLDKRNYEGCVSTTVAIKVDSDLSIVRIIVKNLGLSSDEHPLPIVGMAFSGYGSPKKCLDNRLLDEFGGILLDKWEKAKWSKNVHLSAHDLRWEADLAIRLNKNPDEKILEDIERAYNMSINMAANTMGEFLLEHLRENPEHLAELLDRVTAPKVDSWEGIESSILWFQVLGDLKYVSFEQPFRFNDDVLRTIFEVVERYSPLTPPLHQLIDDERRYLLRADLCDKGSRYKQAIDTELVFSGLEISDGNQARLTEYLEQYGSASVGGIAEFIKSRRSRGDKKAERSAWENTASFCEREQRYDILKQLYEATLLPGLPKALYYLRTEAVGMLVTGITAGLIPWYWVADKIGQNRARRFASEIPLAKVSR